MSRPAVKARLYALCRKALSGLNLRHPYDDNVVRVRLVITDGPKTFINREVSVEISIDQFIREAPLEFKQRLREALNYEATKGETQA